MPRPSSLRSFKSLNGDIIDHGLVRNVWRPFQEDLGWEAEQIKLAHMFFSETAAQRVKQEILCTTWSGHRHGQNEPMLTSSFCIPFGHIYVISQKSKQMLASRTSSGTNPVANLHKEQEFEGQRKWEANAFPDMALI